MRFAEPYWLFGTLVAVAVAGLLVLGGFALTRAVLRFGQGPRVRALVTHQVSGRRTLKGALLVVAVALAFVALARPQYGRGTRLIPATNLDVVLVVDYSKSMFAQDIAPSRISRAKNEVAELIRQLPGVRFGAVAFSGQPMTFPLTSDGGAIAQFFRQLSPLDMPVGGTAMARALQAARGLLARDPLAHKHRRLIVLVTDGEDLQGDPVGVAKKALADGVPIYVVQVGGRTPEPIPEINEAGERVGWRKDSQGKPIMTALSAKGEAQLAQIAEVSHGRVIRSLQGSTGIAEVASQLRELTTEELSERVETIFADVYFYPLGLAILLSLLELWISETRRPGRKKRKENGAGGTALSTSRRKKVSASQSIQVLMFFGVILTLLGVAGCERYVDRVFVHHAPEVDDAMAALEAEELNASTALLTQYLSTGACENGQVGVPDQVRKRTDASYDLALTFFRTAETLGQRFGEMTPAATAEPTPEQQAQLASRGEVVECALRLLHVMAEAKNEAPAARARAYYLAGNLEFLREDFTSAVKEYDRALAAEPGGTEADGVGLGDDIAWNRAIALSRIEEESKEPPEKSEEDESEEDESEEDESEEDESEEDESEEDESEEDESEEDSKDPSDDKEESDSEQNSDSSDQEKPEQQPDGDEPSPEPKQPDPAKDVESDNKDRAPSPNRPQSASQDERMLEMLDRAPTVQEQAAKRQAGRARVTGKEDR